MRTSWQRTNDLTIGTESSRADVDSKTGAHVDTDPEGTTADKIALTQAVLFVSGEPLSLQHLCRVTELSEADQAAILADLAAKLEADDAAGICLRRLEDRYCLTTKSELSNALEKMLNRANLPNYRRQLTRLWPLSHTTNLLPAARLKLSERCQFRQRDR